jgi:hypothetical protein
MKTRQPVRTRGMGATPGSKSWLAAERAVGGAAVMARHLVVGEVKQHRQQQEKQHPTQNHLDHGQTA